MHANPLNKERQHELTDETDLRNKTEELRSARAWHSLAGQKGRLFEWIAQEGEHACTRAALAQEKDKKDTQLYSDSKGRERERQDE